MEIRVFLLPSGGRRRWPRLPAPARPRAPRTVAAATASGSRAARVSTAAKREVASARSGLGHSDPLLRTPDGRPCSHPDPLAVLQATPSSTSSDAARFGDWALQGGSGGGASVRSAIAAKRIFLRGLLDALVTARGGEPLLAKCGRPLQGGSGRSSSTAASCWSARKARVGLLPPSRCAAAGSGTATPTRHRL